MRHVERETIERIVEELAATRWPAEDLGELVAPAHGVITEFQDLIDDLEALRRIDLGSTPPAGPILPVRSRATGR